MAFNMEPTPAPAPSGSGAVGNLQRNLGGAAGTGAAVVTGVGGGTDFADPSDPPVFIRTQKQTRGKPMPDGLFLPGKMAVGSKKVKMSQAMDEFYSWDEARQKAFAKRAWALGYPDVSSPDDIAGATKLWSSVVQEAGRFYAAGKPRDPQDIMELYAAGNADTLAKRAEGAKSRAGTQVTKARQVDLTDPTHARAIIESAFQTSMGRDPTNAEIRTLTRTLNQHEQANPSMASTSTTYDANGTQTAQSTVKSGGTDPVQYVSQQAKADPEAAAYQGATTYLGGLMSILKSGL